MTEGRRVTESGLTVMTQNLYFGAELAPIFKAESMPAMLNAVAEAWARAQASMIEERADQIAETITGAAPDLVALQEAAEWMVGSPSALAVKYDFLSLIIEALHKRGASYLPLAVGRNFDGTAPAGSGGECVRIIDRDAILLRIGDTQRQVRPWNLDQGSFTARMAIKSPVIGSLEVPRGWLAVDASVGQRNFRFINTHLESYSAKVQMAQVEELINGPARTQLPIILAGDFNFDTAQKPGDALPSENTPSGHLITSGMADAWASVNSGEAGYTCCQYADLRNADSALSQRIDLILTRGGITPIAARLVTHDPHLRTPSGLWPSDHAGVIATLRLR